MPAVALALRGGGFEDPSTSHMISYPGGGSDDVGNALAPFFSPDNRWIGFFENTDLKKMSIAGGPAITLCQFSGRPLGASWGDDNTITFATNAPRTSLWRVSTDGGEPMILTTTDSAQHEGTYSFPSVLPLGRGVQGRKPGRLKVARVEDPNGLPLVQRDLFFQPRLLPGQL